MFYNSYKFRQIEPSTSFINQSRKEKTTKLSESDVLEGVQERLIHRATKEGYSIDDTVAIDATHFEARDWAPSKQEKPKKETTETWA